MKKTLFALYSNDNDLAKECFLEGYFDNYKNCYSCFSPFIYLFENKEPDDVFYLGIELPAWGKDAIEQINKLFPAEIEIVHEVNYSLIKTNRGLCSEEEIRNYIKVYSKFSSRAYDNTIRDLENSLKKNETINITSYLLKIVPSDDLSEKGKIIISKFIAILLRMLSPGFSYINMKIVESGSDDYLELIAELTGVECNDKWLSVSNVPITKSELLNLCNIKLVNAFAETVTFKNGYDFKQTLFLQELKRMAKGDA